MVADNVPLMFALIGVVVIVAALLSGFIEKSNFPQVAVFLGIGLLVGPHCLGFLDIGLDAPILKVVATLSLTLVLFSDALTIDLKEVRQHAGIGALILGPGTVLATGLIAAAAVYVLHLPWVMGLMLAAPLASTDPVMLRGLLRSPSLPSAARQGLRLEGALNDAVLLPIILVAMAIAGMGSGASINIGQLLLQMLVVGPLAGVIIAYLGIRLLDWISKRVGIRREYESLYSLGIAMAAYAAAESLHGSGFLAAFAAGLTISSIDIDLCDCFREYGETTAEIFLLFTFVLLGTSVIWKGITLATFGVGIFVALALMARPLALLVSLGPKHMDNRSRRIIIWNGPRGLSTLLLALLPVFAGIKGAEGLFDVATVVVLVSVLVHGGSSFLFGDRPEELPSAAATGESPSSVPFQIRPEEILRAWDEGNRFPIIDVRKDDSFARSNLRMAGALRMSPSFARRDAEAMNLSRDAQFAVFCACPNDETSERVANELRSAGWRNVSVVQGGWDGLEAAGFRVETLESV